MEFGLLFTSHPDPNSEPYPHQAIHARVTNEIIEAEKLGFDSIWIAEHHFSNKYGILPDPFSYLSYLAAKTKRIKLGAAVMVVPLHHPMRIVENAAFVDILSEGRFQLGLGSGYRPYEFEGLGVDFETRRERQAEAIPLILDGFHKKRVSANGKHFNFEMGEAYEIFPQPLQQPHPPFYMGAGTPESMRTAAVNGFGLMQSSLPSVDKIAENIAWYRSHMKDAPAPLNKNPAFGRVDVVRMVYVAPTDHKAKEESEAGITHHMKEAPAPLNKNPAFGRVDVVRMVYVAPTDQKAKEESEAGITHHMKTFMSGVTAGGYLGDVTEKSNDDDFAYDHLAATTLLHGSPDTVIRRIQEFRAAGATSIMLHYPPYYGVQQTIDMLRLFAKEVLPHVQGTVDVAEIVKRSAAE